jgi:hypothetical protein
MARPGSSNASAVTGLVLAAAVLAVSLFLNQSQTPSRLVMPMADQDHANSNIEALSPAATR